MKKYLVINDYKTGQPRLLKRCSAEVGKLPHIGDILYAYVGNSGNEDKSAYYCQASNTSGFNIFDKTFGLRLHGHYNLNISLPQECVYYDMGFQYTNLKHGESFTEEELQLAINPYPQEVIDIVEIMKKMGEYWKDDCENHHIDDIDPYKLAQEILNYFKPKENVKEEIIVEEPKETEQPKTEEVESFDQIVKKRKANKTYEQSKERLIFRRLGKDEYRDLNRQTRSTYFV